MFRPRSKCVSKGQTRPIIQATTKRRTRLCLSQVSAVDGLSRQRNRSIRGRNTLRRGKMVCWCYEHIMDEKYSFRIGIELYGEARGTGKNDGGDYFKCENYDGLFVRIERILRQRKPASMISIVSDPSTRIRSSKRKPTKTTSRRHYKRFQTHAEKIGIIVAFWFRRDSTVDIPRDIRFLIATFCRMFCLRMTLFFFEREFRVVR